MCWKQILYCITKVVRGLGIILNLFKKTVFIKISDVILWLDEKGGLIFLSLLTGGTTLYWKIDEEKYPNFSWFLNLLSEKWIIIILASSISAIFLLSLNNKLREKSYNRLKGDLVEARTQLDQVGDNIYNMFDGVMLSLSEKFGFTKSTKARLSLYINDPENGRFVPCGRYSPDPTLRSKGRSSFSHGQGCIWRCWENDFHYDSKIPTTRVAFDKYQFREYQIPQETCEGLKMRPKLIAGKRIDDALDQPVAVIIFEAKNSEEFLERDVQDLLQKACKDLARLILTFKEYIPIPSDAEDLGL